MYFKPKQLLLSAFALALGFQNASAQSDFNKSPYKLDYKFYKGKPQTPKTKTLAGDIVSFDMIFMLGDSVLSDSRAQTNGPTTKFTLLPLDSNSLFSTGLPLEALYMMNAGDSAVFKAPVGTVFAAMNSTIPEGFDANQEFAWNIKMNKITTQKSINEEKKKLRKINKEYAPLEGGLSYKFYNISKAKDGRTANFGDIAQLHVTYAISDSVLFNSKDMDNGKAVPQQINAPQFEGDLMNGILLMQPGDSASFRISVEDFLAATKMEAQPWMKPGTYHVWDVKLESLKSPAELEEEQKAHAAAQGKVDADIIAQYIKSQNYTTVQKTPSGLQYIVTKQGDGPKAKAGQKVTVNYTGMTTDGKKFDSNVDPKFNHVSPFQFNLGASQVIKGWDEGIELLNVGSKAVLMIPSTLGYGARGAGADIPPNAVLVFEVELVAAD